jgi:hypothetical protein
MPSSDISKCGNAEACPIKEICRRHTQVSYSPMQSWSNFEPEKAEACSGFWPNQRMGEK